MKTNRLLASAIILLALALLLSQSAGAQTAPSQSPAQAATKPGAGSGFSATLSRPDSQAPYKITFQGRLTNNAGQPITTATAFSFKLYDAPSGGTLLFTENATITPDAQGLLTYQIGTATAINITLVQQMANKMFLGVSVGSDAEMNPLLELTFAPYAASLVPGALIQAALPQAQNPNGYGVVNGINTDYTDPSNAGLYGRGAQGVSGASTAGYGVFGNSEGSSGSRKSVGVVGQSTAAGGAGGVFTGTFRGVVGLAGANPIINSDALVIGLEGRTGASNGKGVYGIASGPNGTGVLGTAFAGDPSAIGGEFGSYDGSTAHLGLQVYGQGHATGGFSTGLGYYMTVKYNGSDTLYPGDALALDGNNAIIGGVEMFGTVKATAQNAGAAIGVAEYRLQVYETPDRNGTRRIEQSDTTATSIKPGDFVQIVIAGHAKMKVAGAVNIGDRLAITSSGNISVAAKGDDNIIGKAASQPDKDGYATVFVNLK